MGFQPGFEVRGRDFGIVVGYEVSLYTAAFLQCAKDLCGAWIGFSVADARRVEDTVEDGGRHLLSVGIQYLGPGGDSLYVQSLTGDLVDRRTDPGACVPHRGIHIQAENWFHASNSSSMGIASVRPDAGSTTA